MVVRYRTPDQWLRYDATALVNELSAAKGAVMSLTSIPYQKQWADALQGIQLKHEVAGTSRIEGADFTERELDEALSRETPEEQMTRSQRQATAALSTYLWIARLPDDRPVDDRLIREIHRRIVTGCDDDHCPPGELRGPDQNVIFGTPQHRGADGGKECKVAFDALCEALRGEFRGHDPLIQALALHYHIGAMHPFLDGNGRTARALEALVLQRAGLRDEVFIAMSNYYYDEKIEYLGQLNQAAANGHDLTGFLRFGLRGIASQCQRLLAQIRREVEKVMFRDLAYQLFGRLQNARRRVIAKRQLAILNRLLDTGDTGFADAYAWVAGEYANLQNPVRAFVRDLNSLIGLGAIHLAGSDEKYTISINLSWPTEVNETEFLSRMKQLPKAKSLRFLQH